MPAQALHVAGVPQDSCVQNPEYKLETTPIKPISASKWRSGPLNANIGTLRSKLPVNGGVQVVFYRVHTSVDSRTMKPNRPGEKIEIQPGMTANVEIQTGSNTDDPT